VRRIINSALRWAAICMLLASTFSYAADANVQVQMGEKNASPRALEPLTERAVLRDFRFAWTSMAQALEFNTVDPLQGPFEGDAKQSLKNTATKIIALRRCFTPPKVTCWNCTIRRSTNYKLRMLESSFTMSMSLCTTSCS
jgi:hypothetical protein